MGLWVGLQLGGWSFRCREWGFGFGGGTSAGVGGASGVGSGTRAEMGLTYIIIILCCTEHM